MKINIYDDDGKIVSSISDIDKEAWALYESASLTLMSDQTDDSGLASVMLLSAFMSNVAGRTNDSIFLTGIPIELMEKFDKLLTSVGCGKGSQFLARLIAMAGSDAFHIINNNLKENRFGHNVLFLGIPPETMEGWAVMAEAAKFETGELLARVFIAGPEFRDKNKGAFDERMAEERKKKEAESKA